MITRNLSYNNEDKYIYATVSWDEEDLIVTIEVTDTNVSKWKVVKATFNDYAYCEGTNEVTTGVFQAENRITYELQIYDEDNNKYIRADLFTITDVEFSNSKNARIATYTMKVNQGKGTHINVYRGWSTYLQTDTWMFYEGKTINTAVAWEDFFYIYDLYALPGYTFNAFQISNNMYQTSNGNWTMHTQGNITITTTATPNKYTVTFNANGGSVSTTSKTVTYDSTYGTLPTPSRTGYNFKGWFTATSGGTQIASSTTYTTVGNQTLYAQWTINEYTVTLNPNGGTVSLTSLTVEYNGTYGTLPIPTKAGYKFLGWFTTATGGTQITSSSKYTSTDNSILYAQWDPNGTVRIFVDGAYRLAQAYIFKDNLWRLTMPYTSFSNEWKLDGG